jgi:anti-sigma28 factor (negative regulator of flagellin synthesis)
MVRIGNTGIDHLGGGSVGSVTGAGSENRAASAGQSLKSDSVSLSSAASLVALAKASGASRLSRVNDIGADVRSGKYQPDNAQVSHALVDDHISG